MERERKNDHRKNKTIFGKRYGVKVEVEELEDLLGPDDVAVDVRRTLKEARDERGHNILRLSARMV